MREDEKKILKPTIGEHSVMGGSREKLLMGVTIVQGILHQLEGDNFKLVIEVADGTFTINRYPME